MNKKRRTRIARIVDTLSPCVEELEDIKYEEDDSRENIPESLQGGELYEQSEECSDTLEDAIDNLRDVIDGLNGIT